jgi:hypothetical protein
MTLSRQSRQANAARGWVKRRAREAAKIASPEFRGSDPPHWMSFAEAAAAGIDRLRMPHWAGPMDHVKIDIIAGKPGPWVHNFCPANVEINGRDPVDVLIIHVSADARFVRYDGPLPDSEAYRAEAAWWNGRTERLRSGQDTPKP